MLALAPLLLPLAASQVLTVDDDGGPGVAFTSIQAAVNAAAEGDVVLVRDGVYEAFSLVGKGLTILADSDAEVGLVGQVVLRDLPQGSSAVLRGVRTVFATGHGLVLTDCAGPVRVEECTFRGRDTAVDARWNATQWHGVSVLDCDDLWLVRSSFKGGQGTQVGSPWTAFAGGVGVYAQRSTLALADCQAVGADGPSAEPYEYGNGARGTSGVAIHDSRLWIAGLESKGGHGGVGDDDGGFFPQCGSGGAGGDGVELLDVPLGAFAPVAPSTVVVRGLTAAPGLGGGSTCGSAGTDGEAVDSTSFATDHTATLLDGTARLVWANSPARGGSSLRLWTTGEPDDLFLLAVGVSGAYLPLPGQPLPVALHSVAAVLELGAVGPDGTGLTLLQLPTQPPGFAATVSFQGVALTTGATVLEVAPAGTTTLLE